MSVFMPSKGEEKRTAEARKRAAKVVRALQRKLRAKGYKAKLWDSFGDWLAIYTVNDIHLHMEVSEMNKGSTSLFAGKSGRVAIKFGWNSKRHTGRMRRYPEPNKGFDVDMLTDRIIEYVDAVAEADAREERSRKAEAKVSKQVKKLERQFKKLEHCITAKDTGIRLTFWHLDAEQAEAILKAAQAAGFGA